MVAHASLEGKQCPISRTLQRVGEWWSILILRDVLAGFNRFDQLQRNLGIAPNMLTRRLGALVDAGLIERRPYSERPLRHEYVATERGRDFEDVLVAMLAFGNRQFAAEGRSVIVCDTASGREVEPVMVDAASGRRISGPAFRWVAGPAASAETRERYSMEPSMTGKRR